MVGRRRGGTSCTKDIHADEEISKLIRRYLCLAYDSYNNGNQNDVLFKITGIMWVWMLYPKLSRLTHLLTYVSVQFRGGFGPFFKCRTVSKLVVRRYGIRYEMGLPNRIFLSVRDVIFSRLNFSSSVFFPVKLVEILRVFGMVFGTQFEIVLISNTSDILANYYSLFQARNPVCIGWKSEKKSSNTSLWTIFDNNFPILPISVNQLDLENRSMPANFFLSMRHISSIFSLSFYVNS